MEEKEFKKLLESINQMRLIRAGKMKPGRVYHVDPLKIRSIRKELHQSQSQFAFMIGVSVDTLQNWEQGRRKPHGPALALLRVAQARPQMVIDILHK